MGNTFNEAINDWTTHNGKKEKKEIVHVCVGVAGMLTRHFVSMNKSSQLEMVKSFWFNSVVCFVTLFYTTTRFSVLLHTCDRISSCSMCILLYFSKIYSFFQMYKVHKPHDFFLALHSFVRAVYKVLLFISHIRHNL